MKLLNGNITNDLTQVIKYRIERCILLTFVSIASISQAQNIDLYNSSSSNSESLAISATLNRTILTIETFKTFIYQPNLLFNEAI